jgi:hypothetical protein
MSFKDGKSLGGYMIKKNLIAIFCVLQLLLPAYGKIIKKDNEFYVKSGALEKAIFKVNELIKKSEIRGITIFDNGNIHLMSFINGSGERKLYSIDQQGFMYDIRPYSSYEIVEILPGERFKFKQRPEKIFRVDQKGFFLNN